MEFVPNQEGYVTYILLSQDGLNAKISKTEDDLIIAFGCPTFVDYVSRLGGAPSRAIMQAVAKGWLDDAP